MDASLINNIYKFRAIDDKLSTFRQPTTEMQLAAVAREGFNVVINLALPNDSLPDESGLVRSLGMEYVQFNATAKQTYCPSLPRWKNIRINKYLLPCAANMRVTASLGLYHAINQ